MLLSYTAEELCALNRSDRPPQRRVRKAIFSLQLWFSKRRHPLRTVYGSGSRRNCKGGSSPARDGLAVGLLNARSITKKPTAIYDTVTDRHLDVLALTETWHQSSDDLPLKQCAPPGYAIVDTPRSSSTASRGGGVALLFSKRFAAKRFSFAVQPTTFEVLGCTLRSASVSAVYIVVYRPGSQAVSELFFKELTSLLESVVAYRCQIVICGDFNIHVNDPHDHHARQFAELIESFDLVQSVDVPTHREGNTLDLVITRTDCRPTCCDVLPPDMLSDHSLIITRFPAAHFAVPRSSRTMRPWKKLDKTKFVESLRSSVLCSDVAELRKKSADELFSIYDNTIRRIVDEHVPAYTATVRDRGLTPWFDDDCRKSRRRSRMLERRYRRSLRADDRLAWVQHVRVMHALYQTKENQYWSQRIAANSGNPKKLWKSLSSVLLRDRNTSMPPSPQVTADRLAQFFVDKVDGVRDATQNAAPPTFTSHVGQRLESFQEVSVEDVRRILMKSPPKTCVLDPMPTSVLRDLVDVLLPFICAMCNASLREGHLPVSQKVAVITPILKKSNADPDDPKNYRPISNLTFISKVIERIVAEQVTRHLNEANLMPPLQSAYRPNHSTETALTKVLSDILEAADMTKVTLLGLLDLSAAFDTVDHGILLQRLQTSFGVDGTVLGWFKSFLTGRTQAVAFQGMTSSFTTLRFGVPQGSVLGPLLFLLYTADVAAIAQRHGVSVHSYADDTQLYTSCSAPDGPRSAATLLLCIEDIDRWMSSNRLKLNADKTQFIWLGSSQQLKKVEHIRLSVGGVDVVPLDCVRDLGVTLDSKLTMKQHVDTVARSCFYQLRQLRSIRRSLTFDALRTLVHAFVVSRVDYCNAVLYGVAAYVIRRLQAVLHAAARLISGVRLYDHITPTLRDTLHWLPVAERIDYKIAMMAFNSVRGTCPTYFRDICRPVASVDARAGLRSADRGDLIEPRTRGRRYGPRSFRISAPAIWNNLPVQLRAKDISREQFARGLKTHLFARAYALEAPLGASA